ncbi:MAG: glycosyltransferase family 4 protein, partial [Phycisphaerales bacterium]
INVVILYAKYKNKVLLREICNNGTQPQPNLPLKLHRIFKYKFSWKSKVIAISKRIGDSCRREGIDEDHLWQRPNPVDQVRFAPERKDKYHLREELSKFDHDDIVLLNISKYGPGKNQIFLIDVIKLLEDRYKLLIFGPLVSQGPFRARDKSCYDSIVKAVEDEKLSERVQVVADFTGSIEKYYKLADVFVFPTLFEALGTPMLESIACGVPVVANKIEGVTDCWIENGKTGFVCELRPQKFADCIIKASEIDWNALKQGSASILSKASAEVIDKCYFDLIQNLFRPRCP